MDHSADRLPSLAVLPFTNMSGDPEQEYFADGVVEDILTALSRFKSFAVVARNSSFVYKGRAVDVRQVSKDLGVRYVLEGSVRRAGERLRITAQLIDGTNGAHLWADKYDGTVADVFDVQDRITESVVGVVEPHIREAEIERSRRDRPGSVEAYDLYLQALPRFRLGTEPANRQAWDLLKQALALEPDNPAFLAEASRVVERVLVLGWSPLTEDDRRTCADFARRGLAVAGNDAAVLATCAVSLMSSAGDVQVGMATIKRALDINPNQSRVLLSAGIAHLHHGSLEEAIYCFQRNLRLSPASPSAYVSLTGVAHAQMALGRFEDALATAEQSLALSADYVPTYWMLTSAAWQLGRADDAGRWLRKLLALEPRATVAQIRAAQPFEERVKAILEGLAAAGLPEFLDPMIGTPEKLLQSLPLFEGVRAEVIAGVAKAGVQQIWQPGKVLFQKGDASTFLIAMESGHVRISLQTTGGRELVLQHVRGRAVIGEIGLLDGSTRTADATVVTPTVGLLFDGAQYAELVARYPDLAQAAIRHLCKLLRYTTAHIEAIALYSLDARLARFLLAQSDVGASFVLTLNQSEIADLIGASRPKVNQALAALEAAGAIRRSGAAVTCDRAALRKVAGLADEA